MFPEIAIGQWILGIVLLLAAAAMVRFAFTAKSVEARVFFALAAAILAGAGVGTLQWQNLVAWLETADWQQYFFVLFASIACAFALGVLFSSNIVRMAFYLIVSLGATAGLFLLAGAEFVGAMQLMIYVGGTLVLLIFGVMLTAQSRFVSLKTGGGEWVLAMMVGGGFLILLLYVALFSVPEWSEPISHPEQVSIADSKAETPLGLALSGFRIDGQGSGYLLPFIIVSVHLLVVLIGAAYMARTKRRVDSRAAAEPPS